MLTLEWFLHRLMNQDNKSEIANRCIRSRSMTTARETPESSKSSIFDVIVSPAIHYESAAEHTNDIHEKTLLTWNGACIVGWGGKQYWRTYMNPFHFIRSPFIAITRRTKPTWWYLPRSIVNQPQSIPPTYITNNNADFGMIRAWFNESR